ncbi:hypothetical protein SDC9_192798 [bioreactor metagenome]|uniref:Uncharacterized protein n=1 Tax=bioreactor metagenome TaxID=1076179 RepID=A0A645I1Q8_9ZZZZ
MPTKPSAVENISKEPKTREVEKEWNREKAPARSEKTSKATGDIATRGFMHGKGDSLKEIATAERRNEWRHREPFQKCTID